MKQCGPRSEKFGDPPLKNYECLAIDESFKIERFLNFEIHMQKFSNLQLNYSSLQLCSPKTTITSLFQHLIPNYKPK